MTYGLGWLPGARRQVHHARAGVAGLAAALTLSACTGSTSSDEPVDGGTLRYLRSQDSFTHLDPQRNYLIEDIAFASAFLQRSLTAYRPGDEPADAELTGDLATDTGTPNDDATEWTFALRDDVTFEDGTPITCADVKFGVSRTFDPSFIMESGIPRAVRLLDVPIGPDGNPVYTGPYTPVPAGPTSGDGLAAFDHAVSCSPDGGTITFRLARPAGDFGHAASSLAFSPVPSDTAATMEYDTAPVSSGPYRVDEYVAGERLTLVRNEQWSADTDPVRRAHPDRIEVSFGLDPAELNDRLLDDAGEDTAAVAAKLDPATAEVVEADAELADRTVSGPDVGIRYLAINTAQLPTADHRRAVAAALNRAAVHDASGGDLAGEPADSLIPPTLRPDGSGPSRLWTDALGAPIPDEGNPEHARELIAASGAPMPALSFAYQNTPDNEQVAAAIVESLGAAGIEVTAAALEPAEYHPAIRNPDSPYTLMLGSWGLAWLDASTVIVDLLTAAGGPANLSRYDDPGFTDRVWAAAAELDDNARRDQWSALDAEALANAVVVPLRFDRQLRLVGSAVRGAHIWAPYGALAFGSLWIDQQE